jgi:FkbM family methyltransferase
MGLRSVYRTWKQRRAELQGHRSWAQSGEDLIIAFLLDNELHVKSPTYLDIGAHHPTLLSNTYLFYTRGCRGVLVEPDPVLFETIRKVRGEDVCLQVGVGLGEAREAELYVMSTPTLNTFVREEAERVAAMGVHRIDRVVKVPLVPPNQLLAEHFQGRGPDILSCDVEGLDLEILQSIDYDRFRPTVICVETITYADDLSARKLTEIPAFLAGKGFEIYADTRINTILVDSERWKRRK